MKAFKAGKIIETKSTIQTLEGLLADAEETLRGASDLTNLAPLARWAKVQTALEGERKVLSAVQAMPEIMYYPVQELMYGYTQAQQTLTMLDRVDREKLATVLSKYRSHAAKDPRARSKETRDALKEARNQLALYYECVLALYDDFLQALDGLWLLSGHKLTQQCESNKAFLMGVEQAGKQFDQRAITLGELANSDMSTLKTTLAAEADSEAFALKMQNRLKAYEKRAQVIWQGDGYSAIGQRELIEQRQAELQEALDDAAEIRKKKGATDPDLQVAVNRVAAARTALEADQGRADLQQLLQSARAALQEVVTRIRAIDDETPDATAASRLGMQTLLKESFVFKHQKDLGSPFVNGLLGAVSKHLSLFKEMQPVRAEFEMRLRGVLRMYPALAVSLPLIRVLANRFAPGVITEWV
jgi:hypothetical protein